MSRSAQRQPPEGILEPGESCVVVLEGVVPGFTRWSGLGGIAGIVVALTVPRVLNLGFVLGAITIVAVLTAVFAGVYFVAGRPLARRNKPPLQSPYLSLILTSKRVLLLDRRLSDDVSTVVEATDVNDINTVRYGKPGALMPQRLGFVIRGTEHREYEFPRSESVHPFVEYFTEN